ncbi:heat shock protein Hsp20 [Methylorubrum populi BJ001]|jgi:HSP20 family protein|uniref:Heat shock protein Hsp20 n=1 Tax=Methylorubrum populi (strain ATCC BAA-705 / NCIMB 13946 / BJ001) TaxID=441620 RepID=B1ZAF3_METPB|nr:Hsp20/alpha crystallin family protein [Methylorubrum populi]ACB82009.1 heat shock protein Hsp20 [Methylorubrum populi BJ001]OAH22749.1 heat-shock protein Hsp20 [Methylorubrum populi]PZP69176.1 MAG: Hsp20/alpha crystallin family protein [Methylorubrum populi]
MNLKSLLTLGDRSHSAAGEQRPLALPPHRMMEQMLGDLRFGLPLFQGGAEPRMDIVEKDGQVEITAELPGLARDDVKIELADDTLVISGEKRQEKEATEGARKVTERSYGAFVRTLELPAGIKAEDIQASMDKGILTVRLPRTAAAPPDAKRIEIKGP